MKTRTLGAGGPAVSAIGLGTMSFGGAYGPADEDEARGALDAALEAGITPLRTARAYGGGPGARAGGGGGGGAPRGAGGGATPRPARPGGRGGGRGGGPPAGPRAARRDRVFLATKCGLVFPEGKMAVDGSRAHVREALEAS